MHQDRDPDSIGLFFGALVWIGGSVFINCILWSFAVSTGLLPGLIAGAVIGGLFGGFIGLVTFGRRYALQGAFLLLGPILFILAFLGVIVWVIRVLAF